MLADGKKSSPLCHTDGTVGGVIFTFRITIIITIITTIIIIIIIVLNIIMTWICISSMSSWATLIFGRADVQWSGVNNWSRQGADKTRPVTAIIIWDIQTPHNTSTGSLLDIDHPVHPYICTWHSLMDMGSWGRGSSFFLLGHSIHQLTNHRFNYEFWHQLHYCQVHLDHHYASHGALRQIN